MDKNSNYQFIIMQATIEANKQDMKTNKKYPDDKMMKVIEALKAMLVSAVT